jgi:hypothetical protein
MSSIAAPLAQTQASSALRTFRLPESAADGSPATRVDPGLLDDPARMAAELAAILPAAHSYPSLRIGCPILRFLLAKGATARTNANRSWIRALAPAGGKSHNPPQNNPGLSARNLSTAHCPLFTGSASSPTTEPANPPSPGPTGSSLASAQHHRRGR